MASSRIVTQAKLVLSSIILIFTLGGCSSLSVNCSECIYDQEMRQKWLEDNANWEIKMRAAVKTKEEAVNVTLHWHKNNDLVTLELYDLLGRTLLKLEQGKNHAKLSKPDEPDYFALNAQQLIFEHSGWRIPVEKLVSWMAGLPNDGEKIELDEDGLVDKIKSEPWNIKYKGYSKFQDFTMPSKIKITHPDITHKLAIHEWVFNR